MSLIAAKNSPLVVMTSFVLLMVVCAPLFSDVDNRPIVIVREDDCRATWRTPFNEFGGVSALQYGKQRHIPITWAIITDWATTGSNGYSLVWADLSDYLSIAGGEAASHSATHAKMASDLDYINEIVRSKTAIEQHLPGYRCTTFLQPGAWRDNANLDNYSKLSNSISTAIKANYLQSRAYLGGGWDIGTITDVRKYGLTNSFSIDYPDVSTPTIPAMLATLDIVANTPGLIFCVACHGVQAVGGHEAYCVQADVLKAFMDRLAYLRDSGKIRLMSIQDAFSVNFSDQINHIPDSGLELCNPGPLNPINPWVLGANAQIKPNGGVDNSRYALLPSTSDKLVGGPLILSPGRYELSWYQKPEQGSLVNWATQVTVTSYAPPGWSNPESPIAYTSYTNTDPSVWERKTALIQVRDQLPSANVYFRPASNTGCGVDNISLVSATLDQAISPTGTTAIINPTQLKLTWITPASANGTICIRHTTTTHPLTPNSGYNFGCVTSVPSASQSITMNMNWPVQGNLYLSVFSIAANGSYSPPDLIVIRPDKTSPITPVVNITIKEGRSVQTDWSSSDPESAIYDYQYSVGTSEGANDIIGWTSTTGNSVQIDLPQTNGTNKYYANVKARNVFGYWSVIGSKPIIIPLSIPQALSKPDQTPITIKGIVSAVFADCCYIQEPDMPSAIRVIGVQLIAGLEATVSGRLTTVNGERTIDCTN